MQNTTSNQELRSPRSANSGFTLIELLVVIVMIAALAAIAAPSWGAFLNRQRVNKAQDRIISALQDAQTTAKQRKLSYQVSFRNLNGVAQYVVHPATVSASSLSNNDWKVLSPEEKRNSSSGQLWLRTNISSTGVNIASSTPNTTGSVVFDYFGALPRISKITQDGQQGLNITIAIPQRGDSNQAIAGTKRCVIVNSILGSMTTQRQGGCI